MPPCPGSPTNSGSTAASWTNCFGIFTVSSGGHEGQKYVGEYKDGKRNGQGTYTYASGSKYVGEYKDGKANGQGTYTWADGDKYVGEFKDGKANGQGTYTYASGRIKEGIFKDDKFLYAQKVTPREVWQVEKRLRLDWLVTLTVLEEEKLIWLLEANW